MRTLLQDTQKVMLLAPTGRAAKVFSLGSGAPALYHPSPYLQRRLLQVLTVSSDLNDNLYTDTLFMVDEASMIAEYGAGGTNIRQWMSARRPGEVCVSGT